MTLNLYNDNTIGFDALYAWTATVDDPNGYQDGAGIPSAHYIPVEDNNGVACIFDTVSYNFYYPSSGSLIPGPVIN